MWLWVQTQWRTDGGERTGLDYQGVLAVINTQPIPKKDKPGYFRAMQAMEFAVLDEWFKQR